MGDFFNKSLRDVINACASGAPTPGGGSVSAIVACFGVAMTAMVCNLTVGKEKYMDVEPQVKGILEKSQTLLEGLEKLVDADMMVFNNFMDTYRLPRSTGEEKKAREAAMQKALKNATDTPVEIARVCLEALQINEEIASLGSKMALSDAGVAAVVIEAALKSVLLNVDINIPMIKDQGYVQKILAEKEKIMLEAGKLKERSVAVVRERM